MEYIKIRKKSEMFILEIGGIVCLITMDLA